MIEEWPFNREVNALLLAKGIKITGLKSMRNARHIQSFELTCKFGRSAIIDHVPNNWEGADSPTRTLGVCDQHRRGTGSGEPMPVGEESRPRKQPRLSNAILAIDEEPSTTTGAQEALQTDTVPSSRVFPVSSAHLRVTQQFAGVNDVPGPSQCTDFDPSAVSAVELAEWISLNRPLYPGFFSEPGPSQP